MTYDKLREMAYQIHLDIRPVALVASSGERSFTKQELGLLAKAAATYDDVIFAVVVYGATGVNKNRYFALYSKYQWAIDMYQSADSMSHDAEHALRGLLHGIPARNVQDFLDRCNKKAEGDLF